MASINIAGDTSGSISLTVPSVAGTNTVTIPANSGVVMVSGNMPAFSAYLSSNQSVSSGVATKILFDTKVFDTNNNFASSRFTPTVAGYYQVSAGVDGTNSVGSQSRFQLLFYKNGSQYCHAVDFSGSNAYTISGSNLIYCNGSTDYIEVYGFLTATGANFTGGNLYTWFTGVMVRSA